MTRTPLELRKEVTEYLSSQYLGPAAGESENIRSRPDQTYLVGTLYPRPIDTAQRPASTGDEIDPGDEFDSEPLDEPIESANDWQPSSAAMSFLHDGDGLVVSVGFATYSASTSDEHKSWQRQAWKFEPIVLTAAAPSYDFEMEQGRSRVVSRWRQLGNRWLVTVAVQNLSELIGDDAPVEVTDCLFQVEMKCSLEHGDVLPYRSVNSLGMTHEESELALRYRLQEVYAVGHGASVRWEFAGHRITSLSLDFLPTYTVPAIVADAGTSSALQLTFLADTRVPVGHLREQLSEFVDGYESWVSGQKVATTEFDGTQLLAARRLTDRMDRAVARMREGVDFLCAEENAASLLSFQLAMSAMREQMLQSTQAREHPGERDAPLFERPAEVQEPRWRPFQLGFLLVSLTSTAIADHADRAVVDLIWFPTGGGKTEAYLGLAAFEMLRRRLVEGFHGGGTAVITRYTLRLLATQQFQRAATLICALERIRQANAELRSLPPFRIGLWLGGDTTPNTVAEAQQRYDEMVKAAEPLNPFQLDSCPWCGTSMIPKKRVTDLGAYGAKFEKAIFSLRCPHPECEFHDSLPVEVVDEQMYFSPPSMVLATIDKFARLPLSEKAGAILGAGTSPYNPPTLVIQDELHLLSGPLGTTMAIYEAAIEGVISWEGTRPKIVASTATIRAAEQQVLGIFADRVDLYPPSGLNEEDSYFARVDTTQPGRLYVGLMPQAFTQSSSVVRALAALLDAPFSLENATDAELDAYWTVVAYHNSLRELGRTLTIARDDVPSLLFSRAKSVDEHRILDGDGVVQLTSQESADELPKILRRLERTRKSGNAVDVVVSTNMLSVGIDVSRLGVMLMNGQPKTTSEYIQATSRVGRGKVPGLVITLFRANRPRDRSHYEMFNAFHQSLYRYVEPTSVTPWSVESRKRALAAAVVLLVRHGSGLRTDEQAANFSAADPQVTRALAILQNIVDSVDPDESESTRDEIAALAKDWEERADAARAEGLQFAYSSMKTPTLTIEFGDDREGWPIMSSMRSVDKSVRVRVDGEQ